MNRIQILPALLASLFAMAPGDSQTRAPAPVVPTAVIFAGLAGGANPPSQSITLPNPDPGSTLQLTGTPPPWLTVSVTNQGAQATVTVTVTSQGSSPGINRATIEFTSSIKKLIVKLVAWLATVRPLPDDSAYLVEFKYSGYTGLVEGPECPVNAQGFDMLRGILTGHEAVAPGEHVYYKGTLGRSTSIDFCGSRGRRRPGDDEQVMCSARLIGVASMKVDLEVYGEEGRGAWLKAEPDGSWFTGSVAGDCERGEMAVWERDYPSGESAGTPDGQPIDEYSGPGPLRLFAGGRARLAVGYFPPDQPTGRLGQIDGWAMRVISKLK